MEAKFKKKLSKCKVANCLKDEKYMHALFINDLSVAEAINLTL